VNASLSVSTAAALPIETCPTCGRDVPAMDYCGACGGHLGTLAGPRRRSAYAAAPHEAVLRPIVASTLFPHLPRQALMTYRLALLISGSVLVLLALLRLTGPAIVAAGALLPTLYLLYLYEARVYEDRPWLVIGTVIGGGAAIGLAWAAFLAPIGAQALVLESSGALDLQRLVLGGIALPLVRLGLILVPTGFLYAAGQFRDSLDAFTLGVASALGFGLGETIASVPTILGEPWITAAAPLAFALEIVRLAFIGPAVFATLAGLVAAAVWLRRQPGGLLPLTGPLDAGVAIAVALAVTFALGVLDVMVIDERVQVAGWLVAGVGVLVVARSALHAILLAEGHEVAIGPGMVCPNCLATVPFMAFCGSCGIARSATPKIGRLDFEADRHAAATPGAIGRRASR
jgi:RsiW-degrading membrane proteinase PrsW (M82 family)